MANTIFAPKIFAKETIRNLDRETILMGHVNRGYEGEIKNLGDAVRVQTLPTLTFTASSISGAGDFANADIGSGPAGDISATNFAITLENLIIDRYTEKRVQLEEIEMTQSNLSLEEKVAERFAEGLGTLFDDQIRDQILVTQVADIPTANKITEAAARTAVNIYGYIMAMRAQLKKQNVKVKNMRLFIPTDAETLLLQSDFVKGSDAGVGIMKSGYIGTVGGVPVYSTTALDASGAMIMMADRSVNMALQIIKTKVTEAEKGFYTNVLAMAVWGLKIFGENAKAIVISSEASAS